MSKIECKVSDLTKILNLIGCYGKVGTSKKYLINDVLLNAKGDHIEGCAVDVSVGALFVKLKYKVTVLEEGEIPIGNIEKVLTHLGNFSLTDKVLLSYDNSKLNIERKVPKKISSIPTSAKKFIESYKGTEEFANSIQLVEENGKKIYKSSSCKFDCVVSLDGNFLSTILSDATTVGEVLYPIEVDTKFMVRVGKENSENIETEITTRSINGKAKTSFGYGFDAIVKNLDGEITLYLLSNSPMIITKQDNNFELMYFLAPKLEEQLQTKEQEE